MSTLLQLQDLCVSYGTVEAVHGVHLEVNEGEIVTVIGPNGAGKTTLLCAAMGLLRARHDRTGRRAYSPPQCRGHGGPWRCPGA